jgi:hypothetical protein
LAIRVSGLGADGPIPQRIRRNRSATPHQDLRRGRAGVVDVRHWEHRRQGLEGEHGLQGLLTPVVLNLWEFSSHKEKLNKKLQLQYKFLQP